MEQDTCEGRTLLRKERSYARMENPKKGSETLNTTLLEERSYARMEREYIRHLKERAKLWPNETRYSRHSCERTKRAQVQTVLRGVRSYGQIEPSRKSEAMPE
ncbi:hypothetical protein NERG_02624 [Nematocida ausubeli]|uniref:Uncharacterized protein n=1 Tax=Nematocida ausubeli (strain ATCC PRA-371 / ERTm2) TaxID=1913371 RepID=H8ZGA3_NEMA1|nr:hypothetical protein NERG_02624 [Nematocida ausubeli]